jgi:hypothetical protein
MRPLLVALAFILSAGGCARVFQGSSSDSVQSVPIAVDSSLRVAATQLQHHGYVVTPAGERSIVTAPRPVPEWLTGQDEQMKGRQWFVQVNAQPQYMSRGTRLEVIGYLLPTDAPRTSSNTTPVVQNAVPVTAEHKLYQELRTIAGWIGDAARRK